MNHPVWNMETRMLVELRPYMQYVPHINTIRVTEDEWEMALRRSVTDDEWSAILEARKRKQK